MLTGEARSVPEAGKSCPTAVRSVQRYLKVIRSDPALQREDQEANLAAQLDHVEEMDLAPKGNPDFNLRRLFSEDELLFFARSLKIFADMGWPLDYQQIRLMFSEAAAKMKRVDWKWGQPYICSTTYVAEFVRRSPELKAEWTGM